VSRFLTVLVAVLLLLVAPNASADDAARLGVRFHNIVAGDDQPEILLDPTEAVSSVKIGLKREDGETTTLNVGAMASGAHRELEVRQPLGSELSYDASFEVVWANKETSKFQMRFKFVRLDELILSFDKEDVDLDKRTMSFSINRPATKVELVIVGENKKTLKTVTKDIKGHPAKKKIHIAYPDPGATILFMDLRIYDQTGGYKGVHLTPVSTSIPHDDVEFDSGKWDIRPGQEHKLKDTKKKLDEAIAKFRKAGVNLEFKLYIAGYTDTVGSKSSNQTLSNNRARAIAKWFIDHGVTLDVYYQGFGESVLAKRTPDETDEPRNRRAVYVLATQTPGKSGLFPRTNWAPAK
jgi:hypothetical protein